MFFFLIDAALAVGGVLLLLQQYQTGFQGAKKVGAELVRGLYKLIGTPMHEDGRSPRSEPTINSSSNPRRHTVRWQPDTPLPSMWRFPDRRNAWHERQHTKRSPTRRPPANDI